MKKDMLSVAILAGGLATRLKPITDKIPKSLVEINHEPFIAHQLKLFHQRGITRVVVCAGYLGEQIVEVIGDGAKYGVHVVYSFDGDRLLGTAGAIKRALPLLGDNFLVVYGDSYLPCDYAKVQTAFFQANRLALMTVFHNQGLWDKSNVEFSDGNIVAYNKKQQTEKMQYIDYGLGVFNKKAFDEVLPAEPYDLADLYQSLLAKGELAAYEVKERFYEMGSFAGLKEMEGVMEI